MPFQQKNLLAAHFIGASGISTVSTTSHAHREPPVDGLNLDDAINARYWNDAGFRHAIRTTARLRTATARSISPAGMAPCGISRKTRACCG